MESNDLRKAGLKVTHPRMRILALLDQLRPRLLTPEDIYRHLLEQGVYLAPSGYEVGFLSAAHGDAELAKFEAAVDMVAKEFA